MKKAPAVVALLVLSLLLPPSSSEACSFRLSLWDRVQSADLIVLATVESLEADSEPDPTAGGAEPRAAVLRILDTWKGPNTRVVRVSNFYCPSLDPCVGEVVLAYLADGQARVRRTREALAVFELESLEPPHPAIEGGDAEDADGVENAVNDAAAAIAAETTAEEKATFIAQAREGLRRSEGWATGRWILEDIDFGILETDEAYREGLQDLILRAASLQAAGEVAEDDYREWLVLAAEKRATRGIGIYELLHAETPISDRHHARLAAAFIEEPSFESMDATMLEILAAYRDPSVDRTAVGLVEGALKRVIDADAGALMDQTLLRFGGDLTAWFGTEELDYRGRPLLGGRERAALPEIWIQAKRDLGIPEVAPADPPE